MLEFLGSLQTQLARVCHDFSTWQVSVEQRGVEEEKPEEAEYQEHGSALVRMVMLSVQRVMNRHQGNHHAFKAATESSE